MTNKMIILLESINLMEEGILKGTGVKTIITTNENGEEVEKEIEIPEEIHTFAMWKQMGYRVKRGSHAIAQFPIWKYTKKKISEDEAQEKGFCFLKKASWFTREQVECMDEAF